MIYDDLRLTLAIVCAVFAFCAAMGIIVIAADPSRDRGEGK